MSFAIVIIKNDPLESGQTGVAKTVTAHAVISSPNGFHLTTELEWDIDKARQPPPEVLDNYFGGGREVWFNVGQRRQLTIAFKAIQADESYAIQLQPHVPSPYVSAPGLLLPKGTYRIVLEIRSDLSLIRTDVPLLQNKGAGFPLELRDVTQS